jgi:hypothetical protein
MKIAFLLPENSIAGGIFTVFEHARRLAARGHEVSLIFERERFPRRITDYPGMSQVATRFLDEVGAHESWDVAVATWWETAYAVGRLHAARYAYFVQGFEERFYDAPLRFFRTFVRETFQDDFRFLAVSRAIERYLLAEFGREAAYIECAIDVDAFGTAAPILPRRDDRLRVLIDGAGDAAYKRVGFSLAVAGSLPDVDVVYLDPNGTGAADGAARHYFARVPYDEVPGVFASCDVLLKLSAEESVSRPVLEIFAAGGTAIVTAFEGHDEYLEDGVNCLVVPIDDERAASSALQRLRAEPALLARLRRGARETAAGLSCERSSRRLEEELAALVSRTDDRHARLTRLTRERRDDLHALRQWLDTSNRLHAAVERLERPQPAAAPASASRFTWPFRRLPGRPPAH